MARKKPTMKEMTEVVSNLIKDVQSLRNHQINLEFIIDSYHEYKKDKERPQKNHIKIRKKRPKYKSKECL